MGENDLLLTFAYRLTTNGGYIDSQQMEDTAQYLTYRFTTHIGTYFLRLADLYPAFVVNRE